MHSYVPSNLHFDGNCPRPGPAPEKSNHSTSISCGLSLVEPETSAAIIGVLLVELDLGLVQPENLQVRTCGVTASPATLLVLNSTASISLIFLMSMNLTNRFQFDMFVVFLSK